ncbi:MAG: FecR domain-containing protein [Adhaeribacter sp.]
MRTKFFITGLLCLLFSGYALAQSLQKKVTLEVREATLPQVLHKIEQQYAFRFSYMNNALPAKKKYSIAIKEKPLAEVLDVLLSDTDLGYRESNGQVIIKKGFLKSTPKASTVKNLPAATPENKPKPAVKATTSQAPPVESKGNNSTSQKQAETTPATNANTPAEQPATTDNNATSTADNSAATENTLETATGEQKPSFLEKLKNIKLNRKNEEAPADTTEVKPTHFGIIYPISTNGPQANQYVNAFSAHLLIGTAKGLETVDFTGLASIQKSYVNGAQFSGLMNIVQNKPEHKDLAFARNGGSAVKGAQFAGFMNIANGEVKGGQFAGFMNIARNVKGSQIGVFNIADSISGVPIGIFNFVKHGGYKRAEFYMADDFDANFTYKLGVQKFYSMIALAAELENEKRWAYGFGFGAEWPISKLLKLNTDLISYNVIEESYENFPDGFLEADQLNLLNKFRLLGTLQLAKHLALFGGPTYNVMVSQYEAPGSDKIGSGLVSKTIYDHTAGITNVKMWIGFNAGLRF